MSTKQKKPVEVVVFNNPEKKFKSKTQPSPSESSRTTQKRPNSTSQPAEVESPAFRYDQKKAKYDVRKFAIQSMKKTEKDNAMVDLLVELGAKRPKNKCLHPKEYLQELKRKRAEEKEENLRMGNVSKKRQRKERRRDKDDLLNFVDGQKGWYKDGVQYVNSVKK